MLRLTPVATAFLRMEQLTAMQQNLHKIDCIELDSPSFPEASLSTYCGCLGSTQLFVFKIVGAGYVWNGAGSCLRLGCCSVVLGLVATLSLWG